MGYINVLDIDGISCSHPVGLRLYKLISTELSAYLKAAKRVRIAVVKRKMIRWPLPVKNARGLVRIPSQVLSS